MSNYRRCFVPGGSYFFTVVTERRAKILGNDLASRVGGASRPISEPAKHTESFDHQK